MQTIGERLEEARKRKGVSIREAAEATKIRSDYLQKFESNTYDIGLPEIYTRGFIRNYANYLKISPDKLLTDLNGVLGSSGRSNRRVDREIYGRMDLAEAGRPTEPKPNVEEATTVPETRERVRTISTPTFKFNADLWLKVLLGAGAALIVVFLLWLGIGALMNRGNAAKPAAGTTSEATITPTVAGHKATLTAMDNLHLIVADDVNGQVLFNGTMVRGEDHTFTTPKSQTLRITVDAPKSPQNLRLEVDGKQIVIPASPYSYFRLELN